VVRQHHLIDAIDRTSVHFRTERGCGVDADTMEARGQRLNGCAGRAPSGSRDAPCR
jgi:hypothetical protein